MQSGLKLEIKCPECQKTSVMDYDKVPDQRLKATCNQCQTQFPFDRTQGVNCTIHSQQGHPDTDNKNDEYGWKVDHPACEGIEYRVSGLGGLIRSGLINPRTMLLPPGAAKFYEAKDIQPLRKFFEQRIRMNKARRGKA